MSKPPRGVPFRKPDDYAFIRPQEALVIIPLAWMLAVYLAAELVWMVQRACLM